MRCVIVADDLTGAADSSAALADRGASVGVLPWSDDGGASLAAALDADDLEVLVVETDTRDLADGAAAARATLVVTMLVRHAVSGNAGRAPLVVKKIDSVLRGPIAAELGPLREAIRPITTVIAPAFPRLGRTTVEGVQFRDGVRVDAGAEDADVFACRRARDADVARACGVPDAVLVAAGARLPLAAVSVHDAVTGNDLAALAAQLHALEPEPLIVCSAGLLEALAPHLADRGAASRPGGPQSAAANAAAAAAAEAGGPQGWTLVVSLSTTATAAAQVADLRTSRTVHDVVVELSDAIADPTATAAVIAATINAGLGGAAAVASGRVPVLLTLSGDAQVPDVAPAAVRAAVLETCRRAFSVLPRPSTIVANGGDAARTAVDAWQLGRLAVVGSLAHGAALVRSAGTALVLKSGGFGPPIALTELVDGAMGALLASVQGGTTS